MAAIENYLNEPNNGDLQIIVKDIDGSAKHVLGLVESLQQPLTSIEKDVRASATQLLAEVMDRVQGLPSSDVEPLSDFLCDRIKDHHSIVPHVLTAFHSLSRNTELPESCAVAITRAMFQHAEVQTLIQQHRALAFKIISNLLSYKLEALTMMNEAFPLGYIQMIDGEKDPRNLLSIFRLTQVVINQFPIGVCCEDLFEVTACYFPVDFTPPPGDSLQITRQQLTDELRAVMSSTPRFSSYCVPLLIEKISSDLQTAKQDSFQTLIDCCKVYTVEDLRPFVDTLTQLLLREAMLSPSPKTEELALKATAAMAACLAAPMEGLTLYTDVDEFCKALLKDCKHHLFEPDHKLVVPSVKILQSLVSSSHHTANAVLTDVLPVMLEQLNTRQEPKKKRVYLDMIRQIMLCCRSDVSKHKLIALPSVLEHIVHESEAVSEMALQCLAVFSDSVTEQIQGICARLLEISSHSNSELLRRESSVCLSVFCKDDVSARSEYILQPICQKLSDVSTLELSSLNSLDIITQRCAADICTILLQPLLTCCQQCIKDRTDFVEPVFNSIRYAVSSPPSPLDSTYLQQFIALCFGIKGLEFTDIYKQHINDIIIQLVNSTDNSSLQTITVSLLEEFQVSSFAITTIQSFLCTVPSQVLDERRALSTFLPLSINASASDMVRMSASKICCSVFNKSNNVDDILGLVEVSDLFRTKSLSNMMPCIWIVKALLSRNHKKSQQYQSYIIDCLRLPALSSTAAEGFEVLLKEYPDVLSPTQHPNLRMMYKQRIFITAFPVLHAMFSDIKPELLPNVHIAVTNLIRYVPRQVISNDREMLLRVLIKLLTSTDDQVLLRTLQVMTDDSDSKLLAEHVDTLLPVLLKLTTYASSMQVRISSLQCLSTLSKINTTLLVPHMTPVVKGLVPALDDKKRLVRKEAVKTRNIWCMLRDGA